MNRGNRCYFYEGIGNKSFVDCYSFSFCFASYLVIYFDANCCWVSENLICCLKYSLTIILITLISINRIASIPIVGIILVSIVRYVS